MPEQLWVVDGQHPVLWSIPFKVIVESGAVEMWPAITLRDKERKAVSERMGEIVSEYRDGRWWMTFFQLRKVARQVAEDDPEVYACWHREKPTDYRKLERMQGAIDEFTDALFQTGIGESREEVSAWWMHFRNHTLDWLLNKQKAVDLGFLRLHSSIRRADWIKKAEETRNSRRPLPAGCKGLPTIPKSGCVEMYAGNKFFNIVMGLPRMLAFNNHGTFCRTVEVEHTNSWRLLVEKIESYRLDVLKPHKYAESILAELRRTIGVAAKVFAQRCGYSRAPYPVLISRSVDGPKYFIASKPVGSMAPVQLRSVINAREAYLRKHKIERRKPRKHKARGVRKMQTVQQGIKDVWNAGTFVPGIGHRENSDEGVLVPDAVKGKPGNGKLLAVGKISAKRLAG